MNINLYKCSKCGETTQQYLCLKWNPLRVLCIWCNEGKPNPHLKINKNLNTEIKTEIKEDNREHEDDYWTYPYGEDSGGFFD